MRCPRCKSRMFVNVSFTIEMPVDDMYQVTKRKLQTKNYQIQWVNWDNIFSFHCKKCGHKEKV